MSPGDGIGRVLLAHGIGAGSSVIQFCTHSDRSHAMLLHPNGYTVTEAIQFVGVRTRDLMPGEWANIKVYYVQGMNAEQWRACIEDAQSEVGKPYDWLSLFCWLLRIHRRVKRATHWFCSELVYEKISNQGIQLLRPGAKEYCEVTPADLDITPKLIEDIAPRP